jgi:hypothetical protein
LLQSVPASIGCYTLSPDNLETLDSRFRLIDDRPG